MYADLHGLLMMFILDCFSFPSMSVVLGVGTAASLGGAHMAVATYRDRRRECAEMLALSGSGVGMALAAVTVRQTIGCGHLAINQCVK